MVAPDAPTTTVSLLAATLRAKLSFSAASDAVSSASCEGKFRLAADRPVGWDALDWPDAMPARNTSSSNATTGFTRGICTDRLLEMFLRSVAIAVNSIRPRLYRDGNDLNPNVN